MSGLTRRGKVELYEGNCVVGNISMLCIAEKGAGKVPAYEAGCFIPIYGVV